MSEEYRLPEAPKTCIAVLLEGNLNGAGRHDCAFVIAMELRRMGMGDAAARRVLRRWATRIGYSPSNTERAVQSAYRRRADGAFQYHEPGLQNRAGGRYQQVMRPICADVGCPQNCIPYNRVYQGLPDETYDRFTQLGWPRWLRRHRHGAADDVYRALTQLERDYRLTPGAVLYTSFRKLEQISGRSRTHIKDHLLRLQQFGLIEVLEFGSGSGNYSKDRKPTQVRRAVPIRPPPRT
jgi:hypothetical protein